jgi:hypothetical protein
MKVLSLLIGGLFFLVACGNSNASQAIPNDKASDDSSKDQTNSNNSGNDFSDPVFFTGTETIPFKGTFDCWLEVKYNDDLSQVEIRAIATHPHDPDKKQMAMGPLDANYDAAGKYYRFTTDVDSAPVKDMVLTAEDPTNPTKYGALILHGNHHDPLACDHLSPATDGDKLNKSLQIFSTFEAIKAQNP